jgi:hypothetical protein
MYTVPELSQINENRFQYVHQGKDAPFVLCSWHYVSNEQARRGQLAGDWKIEGQLQEENFYVKWSI